MTYIVAFVSQKGGVGKSTLARLLAREVAAGGMDVKVADLDIQQATTSNWARRRDANGLEPSIRSETFKRVTTALKDADQFDVLIFDGAPHASTQTREVAHVADLVVIPTGQGLDDLEPAVLLAHDLFKDGIPAHKIAFALVKVTDSTAEIEGARDYLSSTPYRVLGGEVPVKTGFSKALDLGQSITETRFRSLHAKADALAQGIIDLAAENGDQSEANTRTEAAE